MGVGPITPQTQLAAHLADTSDAHDASAISFSATGNIVATDVQAAIAELDSEKIAAATLATNGNLLTRAAGVPAEVTRSALAADTAFTSRFGLVVDPTYADGPDATAHIQSLLDAVGLAGGGEVVIRAPGSYTITKLTIGYANVSLVGRPGATLVSSATDEAILINAATDIAGCKVLGVNITGTYANTSQKGIRIQGATDLVICGCTIKDCGDSGIMLSDDQVLDRAWITDNNITHCGNFGIVINAQTTAGKAEQLVISRNYCDGFESVLYPAHGIYVKGAHRVTVSDNVCLNSTGSSGASNILAAGEDITVSGNVCAGGEHGIIVGGAIAARRITVSGNTISELSSSYGVYALADISDFTISANVIDATGASNRGIALFNNSTERPTNAVITGNSITAGGDGAIYVTGSDHVAIAHNNCTLSGNTTAYLVDVNAAGSVRVVDNVLNGGNRNVMARGACTNLEVSRNTCRGASVSAIVVGADVTSGFISNNQCPAHAGSSIAITNSSTGVSSRGNITAISGPFGAPALQCDWTPLSYYGPEGVRSTFLLTQDTEYAIPMDLGGPVDRIGAEVTTVGTAGAVVRLGIRHSNSTGGPGALLLDAGTISGTSATAQEVTISVGDLTPGRYYLTVTPQVAACTMRTVGSRGSSRIGSVSLAGATGANGRQAYTQTGVTGALPAGYTIASSTTQAPLVVIRAA